MKRVLLLVALPLLFLQIVMAQNTSPYWSLAGNSNTTTSSKLGTTNGVSLRFYANNQQRMIIGYNTGNVGIGVTSPTSRLHIDAPSGTAPFIGQANGVTKFYMSNNGGFSVGSSSTPPPNGLYVSGNVGIGTSTPASSLHVAGNGRFTNGLTVDAGGIEASNASGYGVSGISSNVPGYAGVFGSGYYGLYAKGTDRGVFGSGDNIGVFATSKGTGLYANSYNLGIGVQGKSSDANGNMPSGTGVLGDGYYGVRGNGSYAGVYGFSSSGRAISGYSSTGYGVYAQGDTGIYAQANGSYSMGIYGTGYYGLYGTGTTGVYANGTNYGFLGRGANYGVFAYGAGTSATGVYGNGVYGVEGFGTKYGIYGEGTSSGYAGYFDGNVYATGTYSSSDRSLKKEITDVKSAMDIINKLKPKSYTFRQDGDYERMNLPQGKHFGLIAQDVEQVLPGLIKATEFDAGRARPDTGSIWHNETTATLPTASKIISFKALNYTELIPITIKGLQELSAENKELKEENKSIREELSALKQMVMELKTGSAVTTTLAAASLSQAVPNPAKGSARISYTIPANKGAQLLLTDAGGKTIKLVPLTNSGSINLNTTGLSSGAYNYTLVVEGKNIETKKLIVTR